MSDYLIRGMACNNQVRFFATTTKDTVEKARQAHKTTRVVTAALGRLLTAGAIMGYMGKNDSDRVNLQIQCNGPIEGLSVASDAKGNVKGYAYQNDIKLPPKDNGKLDVGAALDLGVLTVTKDIGLKEPYSGQTHLVSGEIAEDLTYYFASSEQIPTSVSLGVLVDKDDSVLQSGGYIIQLLPFATEETISALEKKLTEFPPISELLNKGETPESIMASIFEDMDYQITDTLPVAFNCDCSKERMRNALLHISKKDIDDMINDGEPIEMCCHFCGSKHMFSIDELKEIASEKE